MIHGFRGGYSGATRPSLRRPPLLYKLLRRPKPQSSASVPFLLSTPLLPTMASSRSSVLRDGRTTDHKEMAAIAANWLADRQPEDDDVPMENMVVDDPAPTPSSTPSLPVHCTMTIGEAHAQYMDTVRQKREGQLREAQADAAYNHHLLQEHLQAEEQIVVERAE